MRLPLTDGDPEDGLLPLQLADPLAEDLGRLGLALLDERLEREDHERVGDAGGEETSPQFGLGEHLRRKLAAAAWQGYTMHASTTVAEDRRDALERLARYFLRPPLAKGRLEELPDGQVR